MNTARFEAGEDDPRSAPRAPRARLLRGMPRGLPLLLLLLVVFSCTSGASHERGPVVPDTVLELGASERAQEQRRSLAHVFYRGNALPPKPSAREIRRLERDLEQAPEVEIRELRDLFGNDLELLAYATRDTDGDGVLDFRVSEYRGKFFEGDIDLDGDGVRNVFDAAPYDRHVGGVDTDDDGIPDKPGSFADRDGDGIPDHLDWSRRKAGSMAKLQAALFRDYDIILVERSARFTPELVQAVDDTMRFVFREPISTLRTVAVEDQLLISPDLGDNGFMLGQTQTLTICVGSLEGAEPLVMLGLVIHEVGHAWQLAQDFDTDNLASENRRIHFPPGEFTTSLERFGWSIDEHSLTTGYAHRLYWPHFYATSPRYRYRGYAPNEWAAWFEDLQRDHGSAFLRDSPAMTWGIVGPYSLTSPWEWHADHLMAAIYNRMDAALARHPNHVYRSVSTVLSDRMLATVQAQWSRFDYRNAAGTSINRDLEHQFVLSNAQTQVLVDRYVIPLVDLQMLIAAFPPEPAPATGVGGLVAGVGQTWTDLRDTVAVPVARLQLGQLQLDRAPRERKLEDAAPRPPAAPSSTTPEPEPELEPDVARPDLREALEQGTQTPLGDRHGAGRVGGLSSAAISASAPAPELDDAAPKPSSTGAQAKLEAQVASLGASADMHENAHAPPGPTH